MEIIHLKKAIVLMMSPLDVILRLAYQNKIFSDKIEETNYIENKFKYLPDKGGGYSNFGFYILQNRDYDIIEIKK